MSCHHFYFKTMMFFVFVAAFIVIGCSSPVDSDSPQPLRISEIEVTGEIDTFGKLEIEVHIFDVRAGQFIACSGNDHGLGHVDSSDYRFYTDAWFIKENTSNRKTLYYEDISNRLIQIWVIEDDTNECPQGIDYNLDDIIGISEPMRGRELKYMTTLSFEKVVRLRIGAY